MNRKPKRTPADPHEWFSGTIHHLGKPTLTKIWNVSSRTIELWSADKRFTDKVVRTAVCRLGNTLDALMERGKSDFARSIVEYLAAIVGCTLVCIDNVVPDKESISEELLDDLPVIADFHKSVINRDPETTVREKYRKAKHELDEDLQAYLNDKE